MLWKFLINKWSFTRIKTELFQAVKTPKMPFYAVAKGRTSGIFSTWPDCESQVKGFPGARYKKFDTVIAAQDFIDTHGGNKSQGIASLNKKASSHIRGGLLTQPSTTNGKSTLKRQFSSSNQNDTNKSTSSKSNKTYKKSKLASDDSDDSDDLSEMIAKQIDDIEKRLKGFEKGVDKIIKKSTKTEKKALMIEPQSHSSANGSDKFETDSDGYVQVYTDGACSSNGRNGAKAGLGVYWAEGHPLNFSAPVSGRATNNCGEIQAATCAIKQAIDNGVDKLAINTDSKFLINSVTKWMTGWKQKGWKLKSGEPVKNENDFKELDSIQNKIYIKWNYVEAHKGIHGNERADQLAKAGASMYGK